MDETISRRPLKTRQARWAGRMAAFLTRIGVKPNWISIASVLFALAGGLALGVIHLADSITLKIVLLVCGAACIQLRLLANMLDGMVAVEGGLKTPTGEIYNDFPDRLADIFIFLGAGYAIGLWWGALLGWTAAVLAVLTAYVRLLGGSMGLKQWFGGPMAKQHRMFITTLACLVGIVECVWCGWVGWTFVAALGIIILGAIVTVIRRLRRMTRELNHA